MGRGHTPPTGSMGDVPRDGVLRRVVVEVREDATQNRLGGGVNGTLWVMGKREG